MNKTTLDAHMQQHFDKQRLLVGAARKYDEAGVTLFARVGFEVDVPRHRRTLGR